MSKIRLVNITTLSDAAKEMYKVGATLEGIEIMAPKSVLITLKIEQMPINKALIIKQEMLSKGGDAAISWYALSSKSLHKNSFTDVLLTGTLSTFQKFIFKLHTQPLNLSELSAELEKVILRIEGSKPPKTMELSKKQKFAWGKKKYVMGIINATPDSFYDGGKHFEVKNAMDTVKDMIESGVDIIDVGGESTRPGAKTVSAEEEIQRVIPVISEIRKLSNNIVISIDTYKAVVAGKALNAGADIINDISALQFDENMAKVVSDYNCGVVLMHMKGIPQTMQINPSYDNDVCCEIIDFLEERINYACDSKISFDKIIIDPGIGFGKTAENNLSIIKRLREFRILGNPIVIGVSRKSFIGRILNLETSERLAGSLAATMLSLVNGADIVRAHDFKETIECVKIFEAVEQGDII